MFTSVRIQNFRQFRDLKLEGLGQINLITGANDTGKTSLLEAISLLLSPTDPEIVRTAPHDAPVGRLDEVRAARQLDLRWRPKATETALVAASRPAPKTAPR